ncbi:MULTISPECIES: hypothetical protein [unclassified Lentimonas]|uniref:hypothetical protein n=1 Tax=unclassified Lentimonas TaxID=2630993 RepID=UPI00132574BF|nr:MULTISPECIES: hypothetical protein [unclassified Lentimonas]CAA6676440.1 Unannotated [Lentimonas sp. CC4]CAA6685279.1 Unannotated [Lentimonas sp. CC6]CAA6690328.1 Unannotated [Lentimonas sp. CC10]CAA6693051.1 Unannotated [Lentimonas sp. CC19]CAA7069042.1 Unannotated [Lentimonas sp. CC11]
MDNLEEILKVVGGLVFGAIYLFGNQIFKSKDEDEQRPPTLPRQRGEDDEAAERQREIQEAIRRKIMERRQAAGGATPPAPAQPVAQHREQHKQVAERQKETHQRAPHVEVTPHEDETDGRFSWDESDNVYEQQMQARLQQIELTKRRAEALKRQASASNRSSETTSSRKSTVSGGLRSGSVRSVLRNPDAARTAFIYGEVLGKPVGVRESGSGVAN